MGVRTTVVVVTWRGREWISDCLDAVGAQTSPQRTVVLDNASDDGTSAIVGAHASRPEVVRLGANAGYAGGLAAVLPGVDTEFVAWLNDDAVPDPDWLAELEAALDADPGAGAASARLVLPDGSTQSVGVRLTADGHGADAVGGAPFGFCGGAALVRVSALAAVGGVPADFFCYYEDTDTSWRLRLHGWSVLSVPAARVVHGHGASSGLGSPAFHRWNERNRLLMLLRCAPLPVALGQVARFALLTAVLPARPRQSAPNFHPGLRARVLAEVLRRLPAALRARTRTPVDRRDVWRAWAGR